MAAAIRLMLIIAWLVRGIIAKCQHSDNCIDCVNNDSWLGDSCRWCPVDKKCHAFASPKNKCKSWQNIVDEQECPARRTSQYVPDLSYKMLLLSSVAYDKHDPQGCVDKVLPSAQVKVHKVITRECDWPGNKCSAYLATSDIEKAIIVAFRGSNGWGHALAQFAEVIFRFKTSFLEKGEVQNYWHRVFTTLWDCMQSDIETLHSEYPDYEIWVTGHSLGGAVASLASTWLAYYNTALRESIVLYTYGMPRVGNGDHAFLHDALVKDSWRVVNYKDPVPHFPSMLSLNVFNRPYHHGVEVYYTKTATSVNSDYKICDINEQEDCSRKLKLPYNLENHKWYFAIPVGTYCSSFSRKKRDSSFPEFEFSKEYCSSYVYRNGSYVLQIPVKSSAEQTVTPTKVALMVIIAMVMKPLI